MNTSGSMHQMAIRLKSGIIQKKDCNAFITSFPELQSLQLTEDQFVGYTFIFEIIDVSEPSIFKKAASRTQWQQAIQEEYDSLRSQGTWVLVTSSNNKSIVGSKLVYKVKKNLDGSVSRYKAKLMAQGFP